MQYSGAGQQGPRKDTDSCPKKKHDNDSNALHNQSTLQIRKLEKSTLAILDLKTDNFEKFTVDGNAFQTLITWSTISPKFVWATAASEQCECTRVLHAARRVFDQLSN